MSDSTQAVADDGTTYVRVGLLGLVQTSPDGLTWTAQTSGVSVTLWDIVYGEGLFVVVGDGGTIITSPDGATWTTRASGVATHLHGIAYADSFVAVGDAGVVLMSEDGIAWGTISSQTTEDLWSVSASGGVYIAVGDNSTIITGAIISEDLNVVVTEAMTSAETVSSAGSSFGVIVTEDVDLPEVSFHDLEPQPYYVFVSETVLATNSGSDAIGKFNHLAADAMQLTDRPFINNEVIVDACTMAETILGAYGRSLTDGFTVDDTAISLFLAHGEITDAVTADDALLVNGIWLDTLTESISADDTLTVGQIIQEALSEGVAFALGININNEVYVGWAMNSAHFGVTKYVNYGFNSFANYSGVSLGANASGIFELTGTSDNGTDIDARIKFGITDFNIPAQKRVHEAFLGIRNDGSMILKTYINENTERWYELRQIDEGIHTTRIKLGGRGVKSNYWQFELLNKDGADFELDNIQMTPIVLTRKTKR